MPVSYTHLDVYKRQIHTYWQQIISGVVLVIAVVFDVVKKRREQSGV